jgi:hypothetical protein
MGSGRLLALLEPFSIFAMIMAYIWELRVSHHGLWIPILALMLISHAARREGARRLGFHLRTLRPCLREYAPLLAFLALLMIGLGILLQTTRPIGFGDAFLAWAIYIPWGLFQQYVLNGYFLNRFDSALPRQTASLTAAILFSGVHLPNWFLMTATFLAGYCSSRIYRKYKNLYFLGLAHATIGFLLFLIVPDSVSHHLRVGPGWYRH